MTRLDECPRRILVVDDDDAMHDLIDRVLREAGYETRVAPNGLLMPEMPCGALGLSTRI
jgi:CheY-like chemotaxis protein